MEVHRPTGVVALAQRIPERAKRSLSLMKFLADVVLIDEWAGRQQAIRRGLKVTGTLSVLDEADLAGLVVFDDAIIKLRKTSFRLSDKVLSEILKRRVADVDRKGE